VIANLPKTGVEPTAEEPVPPRVAHAAKRARHATRSIDTPPAAPLDTPGAAPIETPAAASTDTPAAASDGEGETDQE
jgi:hypothetical protein